MKYRLTYLTEPYKGLTVDFDQDQITNYRVAGAEPRYDNFTIYALSVQ